MTLLEARGLTILRGDEPLFEDLNLSLEKGEVLQIEGTNGSGKTTLLRTLCGLVQPDDGEILWLGTDLRRNGAEFREASLYLGHKAGIKAELSATENLSVFLATNDVGGQSGKARNIDRIAVALERTGMADRAELPCAVLSAGQKRRVALARLLLSEATLWVLDEPLTSLDQAGRDMVFSLMEKHVGKGGSILCSTHQPLTLEATPMRAFSL